ncbi:MAG: hypothetical protein ISS74_07470 [Planctomycetes bacterium]|nr:hypothetical protein [Planctomycetota bacterium]
MKPTQLLLLAAALAVFAGCQNGGRAWQRQAMPVGDRPQVFQTALAVLEEHFEIADSNIVRGTMETKPQIFDGPRGGTLADLRGAGGAWRRTVFVEVDRDGLTVVAAVAVRLEREATDAAVAQSETVRTGPSEELPPLPDRERPIGGRARDVVWVEVGYDDALARELLGMITSRLRRLEDTEGFPELDSVRKMADEMRRMGGSPEF